MVPRPSTVRAARDKIVQGWVRRYNAQNAKGESVKPSAPDAVCWCLGGVLWAVGATPAEQSWLRRVLVRETGYEQFWQFNDVSLKADVIAFLDKAIAAAEAEQ